MILVVSLVLLALLLVFRNSPEIARWIAAAGAIAAGGWMLYSGRNTLGKLRERRGDRSLLTFDLVRFAFGALCAALLLAVAVLTPARVSQTAVISMAAIFGAAYVVVLGMAIHVSRTRRVNRG